MMPFRAPAASGQQVYFARSGFCTFKLLSVANAQQHKPSVNHHAEGYVCLLRSGCRPLHDSEQVLLAAGWALPTFADLI